MHRLKLSASAGILIALIAIGVMDPGPARSQGGGLPAGKDVRVINSTAEAVPVVLSATGTVKGDVNVVNTPDVKVANTPDVKVVNIAGVNVVNTPTVKVDDTQPVQVVEVGGSGREPFQVRVALSNNISDHDGIAGFSVPAGKQLVIEHLSAWMNKPGGIMIDSFGTSPSIQLPVRSTLNFSGGSIGDRFSGGMEVTFYAEGNQRVIVSNDSSQPAGNFGALTVVGYLVPAS